MGLKSFLKTNSDNLIIINDKTYRIPMDSRQSFVNYNKLRSFRDFIRQLELNTDSYVTLWDADVLVKDIAGSPYIHGIGIKGKFSLIKISSPYDITIPRQIDKAAKVFGLYFDENGMLEKSNKFVGFESIVVITARRKIK